MDKKMYTLAGVVSLTDVDKSLILRYEEEGLISPANKNEGPLYSEEEVEKIKMIKRLTDDLEVNFAGVEVILNMREQMMGMQSEFAKMIEEMKTGIFKEFSNYETRLRAPRIESRAGRKMKVKIDDA